MLLTFTLFTVVFSAVGEKSGGQHGSLHTRLTKHFDHDIHHDEASDDAEEDSDNDASGDDDENMQGEDVDSATPDPTDTAPAWGDKLEALTPIGEVLKAKRLLQENLVEQGRVASLMSVNHNESAFNRFVDTEAARVAAETNSQALAMMLGKMRKETRKFSAPFYLEWLAKKRTNLLAEEVTLKANLDVAQSKLKSGPQGWRVVESKFNKITTLRGATDEQPLKNACALFSGGFVTSACLLFSLAV
eukprot:TRINITY_DN44387_c0_g1_i1.p1 TRINITY_DN44387_c0_g1~~TRINITY_DN44387_c0_g1_i1.p1  ORF type:complete len:246 (+),score=54.92 TRINITY_DN44387_c0_g1_i1:133-870(+)